MHCKCDLHEQRVIVEGKQETEDGTGGKEKTGRRGRERGRSCSLRSSMLSNVHEIEEAFIAAPVPRTKEMTGIWWRRSQGTVLIRIFWQHRSINNVSVCWCFPTFAYLVLRFTGALNKTKMTFRYLFQSMAAAPNWHFAADSEYNISVILAAFTPILLLLFQPRQV